ncbi:MAG: hypothetical protein GY870_08230 [archaeon]|nr:hypothetical protein [archaeon]
MADIKIRLVKEKLSDGSNAHNVEFLNDKGVQFEFRCFNLKAAQTFVHTFQEQIDFNTDDSVEFLESII